jgi:hypothetical protein
MTLNEQFHHYPNCGVEDFDTSTVFPVMIQYVSNAEKSPNMAFSFIKMGNMIVIYWNWGF